MSTKDEILKAEQPPEHNFDVEGISPDLIALGRWINWRWIKNKKSKWTKVPCDVHGYSMDSQSPENWQNFATVIHIATNRGYGIGFVFNNDGLNGFDFDDCRNPENGYIEGWAQDFVKVLASYSEVSPSGTGLKVFVRGEMPAQFDKQYTRPEGGETEVYATGRFFTVTGQRVENTPFEVRDRGSKIAMVLKVFESWKPEKVVRQKSVEQTKPLSQNSDNPIDDREKALAALDVLDPSMVYGEWLKVGMSLHSLDASLLTEWENWSAGSEIHCDGECDKKWKSFKGGNIAIATLFHMADQTGQDWRPKRKAKSDDLPKNSEEGSKPSQNSDTIAPHAKITRMSDVQPEKLAWVWEKVIPRGKLTLFTGDPGLGKSFITLDIASRVTRGDCWPNDSTPTEQGAVILFAAEDDIADTIRPRLDAAGAEVEHVYCIEGITKYDGKGKPSLWSFQMDRDLPILESELERLKATGVPVRLIVIDPISCYLGKTDSHNNAEVRGTLAPLAELASRYQVSMLLVSHLNKSGTGKAVYRSSGSLAFAAAARSVWVVTRDLDLPSRRLMLPVKMNLCAEPAGLAYSIIEGRIGWEADPVKLTADEFLAQEAARDKDTDRAENTSEFNRAVDWLKGQLADGRVDSKTLKDDAKENDISYATLRRAFNNLEGKAVKDGKQWFWLLPEMAS